MLVTLLGIVTLVRLVQPKNAAVPDAGDAVADRDAGQAGAAKEHTVPDAGDAVGDRDAGQAGAASRTHEPPMRVTGRPSIVSGMATAPPGPVYPVMVIVPLLVV